MKWDGATGLEKYENFKLIGPEYTFSVDRLTYGFSKCLPFFSCFFLFLIFIGRKRMTYSLLIHDYAQKKERMLPHTRDNYIIMSVIS
jgi:hypothetical protein